MRHPARRQLVAEHRKDEARSQDRQEPNELCLKDLLPAIVQLAFENLNVEPRLENNHCNQDQPDDDFERIHDLLHAMTTV
jgi:hypothetical protein